MISVERIKMQPLEAKTPFPWKFDDCNDKVSRSDTYSLSEGVKYPQPNLDDEKPKCKLLECSPHLGEDVIGPGFVSDAAAVSLLDIRIDEDYGIPVTKGIFDNTQQFPSDMGLQ